MSIRKYDGLIIHTGAKDVSLHFPNENYVYGDLRQAFDDQERVTIEIKSRRKPRSLKQNNLFHAYCGIIAEETGNSLDVVKSTLKAMYCRRPFLDSNDDEVFSKDSGEVLTYIQDTRDMSTIEMVILTEQTRLFALEWFGIDLPLPEEQIKFNYANKRKN